MKIPSIVTYTVLRLLAFLVPLGILWFFFPIFHEFWWLAAIFAALIGVSISLLFLRTPLSGASTDIYRRRMERNPGLRSGAAEDADVEDTFVDQQNASAPEASASDTPGDDAPRA